MHACTTLPNLPAIWSTPFLAPLPTFRTHSTSAFELACVLSLLMPPPTVYRAPAIALQTRTTRQRTRRRCASSAAAPPAWRPRRCTSWRPPSKPPSWRWADTVEKSVWMLCLDTLKLGTSRMWPAIAARVGTDMPLGSIFGRLSTPQMCVCKSAGVCDVGGQPPDDVQPAAEARAAQTRHRRPCTGLRPGAAPLQLPPLSCQRLHRLCCCGPVAAAGPAIWT